MTRRAPHRDGIPAGGVPGLADTAVALNWVTSAPIDRVDLLVAFLHRLDRSYGQLVREGPRAAMDEWRRRSATLGRRVRVDLGVDDVEGTAVDVTPEGHLVVEALGGQVRTFAVGACTSAIV